MYFCRDQERGGRIRPRTSGRSACSPSSTRSRGDAWRSSLLGGCVPTTCCVARSHEPTRPAGTYSVRQCARVRRQAGAQLAWPGRREDALHRAGIAVGERILRELQLQAPRRVACRRTALDTLRSPGAHRALAAPLQWRQATFVARLSTHQPPRRSCHQHPAKPTLPSGRTRCWPVAAGF